MVNSLREALPFEVDENKPTDTLEDLKAHTLDPLPAPTAEETPPPPDTIEEDPGLLATLETPQVRHHVQEFMEQPSQGIIKIMQEYLGDGFEVLTAEQHMQSIEASKRRDICVPAMTTNGTFAYVIKRNGQYIDFITVQAHEGTPQILTKLNYFK